MNSALFVKGQNNTFTVCAPGGPGTTITQTGTLPAGVTFTDNLDGTATLSGTPTVAGDFPLHFSSTNSVAANQMQDFDLTVNGPATHIVVTVNPTSLTAGGTVTGTVTAYDAQGAVATTDQDAPVLTSTDPLATLSSAAFSNGVGSFTGTLATAGSQTITATSGAVTGTSNPVTVVHGAVLTLAVHAGNAQSTPAGHSFGLPLLVLVTDSSGNPVAGETVAFSPSGAGLASFAGSTTGLGVTDAHGLATSPVLTAGGTVGPVVVTATDLGPVSDSSTSFSEIITASDAAVAATPRISSGVGTAPQSVQLPLLQGGSVTLLDGSGQPATIVVTAQGTYVLDPTTGVVSFVAVAGFAGTATPATYRLTDGSHQQATSTYTPTVAPLPPLGVARVGTAPRVVLTGSTLPATCAVTVAAIGTCRTVLTSHVGSRTVVIGQSGAVIGRAGATKVKTVIQLTSLGRALAARPGGFKATIWASITKADGRTLSAKAAVTVVDKHVVVPAVLFPATGATLTTAAHRQLKALRAQLGAVHTVTCVGYADAADGSAAELALGKARAKAVCAALAGHGVRVVVLSRVYLATKAGRALSRRVEISLTY